MIKKINNKKGFTIVETLIAVLILSAAILGATSAAQTGISSYIYSKNQIIAFYLAQEGFEQIRNLRDENYLKSNSWLTGIAANNSDPCYFGKTCTVSPVEQTAPIQCSGGAGTCLYLRQDLATGFYGYNAGWTQTVFQREISLTQLSSDEVAITVVVNWSKGDITRQFKARENIFNWQ